MNEADLQQQAEQVLRLHGFVRPGSVQDDRQGIGNLRGIYIHVPNQAFERKKTAASLYLKNLPDLMVLKWDGSYFVSELKVGKNKKQRGQKSVGKIIPVPVHRTIEEFTEAFRDWLKP